MSDNLYNPSPVPENPDCGKPPVPPCPPVPPAPDFPPFCPEDRPQMGRPHMPPAPPMPPVPSVVSGMDLYEAMNHLSDRVNVCIHNYNAVMAENYKTLHNLQRAAQENGAYYGPGEVWVEEGYNADEGATYHLIHKACVDRRGEPIRMQLHLAYGNTTNSKIEQPMFAASKVEFADKMVVAIPKGDNGWYGKAIWHGCPIASAEEETLWTVGFTQGGVMRVYNNGVTVDQMLRDTIENAMGVSGVLIQNGQICDDSYTKYIPKRDEQASRVVMGQVLATREVIILTVGNENDVNRKGLTSATCAQILKQYGCDIAVELCEGSGSGAMDKGSLMYVPDDTAEPSAYAYWFISRKCFYKNDYERELAELVQNYGACLWQGFLNKKAIAQVKSELDAEIERAKAAEEALDDKIDEEIERAKSEEQRIEGKLDDEIDRAKSEEARIEKKVDDETDRAKGEEQRIEDKLDAEIARSTAEDERLDGKIDDEITRAKAAEQELTEALDAEVHRATNAEAVLHQEILTEQGQRIAGDETLQTNINKEIQDRTNADKTLQGNIDALALRVTQCETNITNLQTLCATLLTQMASLDSTVSEMVNTVAEIETTLNNLKTAITNIINGTTRLPYVRISGDTMTGSLQMADSEGNVKGSLYAGDEGVGIECQDGTSIHAGSALVTVEGAQGADVRVKGVANPVDDNDAVNKGWLTGGGIDDRYVKKTGDDMSGDLGINSEFVYEGTTYPLSYITLGGDRADEIQLLEGAPVHTNLVNLHSDNNESGVLETAKFVAGEDSGNKYQFVGAGVLRQTTHIRGYSLGANTTLGVTASGQITTSEGTESESYSAAIELSANEGESDEYIALKISSGGVGISHTDKTYFGVTCDGEDVISASKDGVSLGGHKITDLATPTDDADAATKKYIDDLIAKLKSDNSLK